MTPSRWILGLLAAAVTIARAQEPQCPTEAPCTVVPSDDARRLVTGTAYVVIGAGNDPQLVADGPLVITALSSDCLALFYIATDGNYAAVTLPFTRIYVPAGAQLVVAGYGFCKGQVLFSGFVP